MLMWVIIISLLLIGLILLIVEVVFIPGTTIVGLLGVVFSIIGVTAGYYEFGSTIGFYILLSTAFITAIALFFSFKAGVWRKMALKSAITSKVNEGSTSILSVGDVGITTSVLRPSGKAEFHDNVFEVRTQGTYIEPQTKIKIIQIDVQTIVVEPINT